ncbi:MAG: hypothetical protein R2714_07855 [Microthrixaceae bacterium]|nr:hypothetical protein [Microthrixaceae bacterium]
MTTTEVSIPSRAFSLGVTLPAPGDAPGPAALLVSGSGPLDRDSTAKHGRFNVMSQIASHLAADGVASLRHDKTPRRWSPPDSADGVVSRTRDGK